MHSQALPCTCLAHHELEIEFVVIDYYIQAWPVMLTSLSVCVCSALKG